METTAELAGFFAAHAIWCVSDGEPLIPMLAYLKPDGERGMDRIALDNFEEAVAAGQQWLAENKHDAAGAVLLYDAYVTLESGKTDALVLEARQYDAAPRSFQMIVPYRNAQATDGFAVHRPKLVSVTGYDDPPFDAIADAFFRGVDSHEKGAEVWSAYLDESR